MINDLKLPRNRKCSLRLLLRIADMLVLVRHSSNDELQHPWCLPSKTRSPVHRANTKDLRRLVMNQTGLDVKVGRLLSRQPAADGDDCVEFIFAGVIAGGALQSQDANIEARAFSPVELAELTMSRNDRAIVEQWLAGSLST